jgi:hypothetical protein
VIIPGFGGFIGNYGPSRINPVSHTFYPPFKALLFNIHLRQNDGLLASWISQAENVSYEMALKQIRKMQERWNEELENGGELVIERVGKIVKETNGTVQFEQDYSINYLPESFGLSTMVSPAIRRQGMQDKFEHKIERYINSSSAKPKHVSQTLKWAAAMALPVGLAVYLSFSNIDQIRNFHEEYTSFLFTNSKSAAKKPVVSAKVILPPKQDQPVPDNHNIKTGATTVSQETDNVQKPYAIIIGAFRFRENAENLISELKQDGYNALIYDVTKSGLFRVTLGTFNNREEAIGQLTAVRSHNFTSAWLLSK